MTSIDSNGEQGAKQPRTRSAIFARLRPTSFELRTSNFELLRTRSLMVAALFLSLLLPLPGCGDKESAPELITLEGKIEKLERTSDKTGKLTVVYYNEKQKQEMPGTGDVTAETEIMIDGAIATLADLSIGQRVRGEVRVEKKGGKKVQTVVKIQADRAKAPGG